MSNFEFIIVFVLASEQMVDLIKVLLDNQLGYCCCMGVPQDQATLKRVQARKNRLRKKLFSGWDRTPPRIFQGHPMSLGRGHSGDDCGHNNWDWFWNRERLREKYRGCMCRGWGRFRSQDDRWFTRDCTLQEPGNAFYCNDCSFTISLKKDWVIWIAHDG